MEFELSLDAHSPEDAADVGAAIGAAIADPVVIALVGEMGSGKTTIVRGIARGLGVTGTVNSPTYTLMQRYQGRFTLDHYDAWMEGRERDVLADGAHELLGSDGVSVIEWADRILDLLPSEYLEINIKVQAPESRLVTLKWHSTESGPPAGLGGLGQWIVT